MPYILHHSASSLRLMSFKIGTATHYEMEVQAASADKKYVTLRNRDITPPYAHLILASITAMKKYIADLSRYVSKVKLTKEYCEYNTLTLAASRIVIILSLLFFNPYTMPLKADEISDLTTILGGDGAIVKKWIKDPKLSIIYEGNFDINAIENIIEHIGKNTGLKIQISSMNDANNFKIIYGHSKFKLPSEKTGGVEAFSIIFGEEIAAQGDIFLFNVSPQMAAYLSILTGRSNSTSTLARQFAEGRTPCYFEILSRDGKISVAFIYINNEANRNIQKQCLYEELNQSMGIVNDAQDSRYFTFDNNIGENPNNLDWKVLRAIYSKDVTPGESISSVLREYLKISKDNP